MGGYTLSFLGHSQFGGTLFPMLNTFTIIMGGQFPFLFCSLHLGRYSNDIPVHNVDFMTIGLLSTAKMGGDDVAQTDLFVAL